MSRFKIVMTQKGNCDIHITLFDKDNTIVLSNSSTYYSKPTIKELKEQYKQYKQIYGAVRIRITTMPRFMSKTYKL